MKILKTLIYTLIILIFILFLIRYFSEKQLDDVNPNLSCNQELLEKADAYYVIPLFDNKSLINNPQWCEQIKKRSKKLALHGVYHTYKEFDTNRDQEYLEKGIKEFQKCFNQTPTIFKPPQITISKINKKLIKKNNLKLDLFFNQLFHKVYHCEDSGKYPNWFIDLF